MALRQVLGERREINRRLLLDAIGASPSLFIDCSGCANPHPLFPEIRQEDLYEIYVVQVDLLYAFRDAVKRIPEFAAHARTRKIFISTIGHLFHYDNERENREVYEHALEMLASLGKRYDIMIALSKRSFPFADRKDGRHHHDRHDEYAEDGKRKAHAKPLHT